MATSVEIIEFFGLPGCGKTTLCNQFVDNNANWFTRAELAKLFKASGINEKLRSFPIYIIIPLLSLFASTPFVGFRNYKCYRLFFFTEWLYNFASKKNTIQKLYYDHGLCQTLISLMYCRRDKCRITKTIGVKFQKVIEKSVVNKFVYCQISPEVSMHRIKNRKKSGPSRMDRINSEHVLKKELLLQYSMFKDLYYIVKDSKGKTVTIQNTDENLSASSL